MTQTIVQALSLVDDSRSLRGRSYRLHFLLAACIAARSAGAQSLREISDWIDMNRQALRSLGVLLTRTPKKSQLANIFAGLDLPSLCAALKASCLDSKRSQLAVDGKEARGSGESFFSVFDSETCEALARIPFGQGQEPQALLGLLRSGSLSGRMVSADAAHCQKKHSKPRRIKTLG